MSRIVGIDLGTSTSEIAVLIEEKPLVLPDEAGNKIMPSIVGISEDGELVAGRTAKEQLILRPQATVMEVKRMMGSGETVVMNGKQYSPEEISSYILSYLKEYAEDYLNEKVDRAVITVPAYFTDEQRRATVEAGKMAGFKVERIINEPTAAALAFGIEHMKENQYVLVYDLGGGTLDVTLLEMFEGVLDVKASSGNNQLGGKDFDERLIGHIIDSFRNEYGIILSEDLRAMARIKEAAEQCKKALSSAKEYRITLPFIATKDGAPLALEQTITRENFEGLIKDLIESTRKPIEIVLKDSAITAEAIDTILLVGGSTRIPMVKEFLSGIFGKEPQALVDPDLAVVMGAAVQAAILNDELSAENDILITDVCPYTLGIETLGYLGGMPLPDYYTVLINRNTTIPVMKEEIFSTVSDYQDKVEIKVYQGDNKKASLNNLLGHFMLQNVPPAPAGEEKIRVKFAYDVNGILQVEAFIVSTGEKAGVTIETTGVKPEEDIDISLWKDAPDARKYRAVIKRAESLLEELEEDEETFTLSGLLTELKKALIREEERAEQISEEINELMYDLEG